MTPHRVNHTPVLASDKLSGLVQTAYGFVEIKREHLNFMAAIEISGIETNLWISADISVRLEEAVDTLFRLPVPRPSGYRSSLPNVLRDFGDVFAIAVEEGGYRDMKTKPGPPEPAAIDRTIEVLYWLRKVSLKDRQLLWARASRRNYWWKLAGRFGMGESTLKRKHSRALRDIADWLNSKDLKIMPDQA